MNEFRKSNARPTEGTLEKAQLSVTTTWDCIVNHSALMTGAIKRLTKKTNGAKSTGLKQIWDLAYLFEYVDGEDITKMKSLASVADSLIIKLRAVTGWRSADLTGLFPDYSFDWTYDPNDSNKIVALRLRTYNTKTKKGVWSAYTTIPVLTNRYRHLCAVRALREFLKRWNKLKVTEVMINNPDGPGNVAAKPLLVYTTKKGVSPYQEQTISSKFKQAFLDNVRMVQGNSSLKLSALYKSHSCRNAVASTLNDFSVSTNAIASHMNTSVVNLESTYITKVVRDWSLPMECATKHTEPAAKVLLPYIHYISSQNGGQCDCSNCLGSIPK